MIAFVERNNTAIIASKNDVGDDWPFQIVVKQGIWFYFWKHKKRKCFCSPNYKRVLLASFQSSLH